MNQVPEQGSFRDRDGFVFYKDAKVFRAIHPSYLPTWEKLIVSPFFTEMLSDGKIISFSPAADPHVTEGLPGYRVIEAARVPFISYPVEWPFVYLKKAALLTLSIQLQAMENGFTLKDASAYNVQFVGTKPVFIDHLSFGIYEEGEPWHPYRQFCQHFLGPLLLMHYGLDDLKQLYSAFTDGIPLHVISQVLPWRSRLNLATLTHLHLNARFEKKHAGDTKINSRKLQISKQRSIAYITHLKSFVQSLQVRKKNTGWTGYYNDCSYTSTGLDIKKKFVEQQLTAISGALCVDLGANTGEFSELACKHFHTVVACDNDLEVVSRLADRKISNLLCLHVDISNPTPATGWNNEERKPFSERIREADCVMALALMHHLCIGNNVPMEKLASYFANIKGRLIIEWVPKDDPQAQRLLVTRKDVFEDYTLAEFRRSFAAHYDVVEELNTGGTGRILFHFKKHTAV